MRNNGITWSVTKDDNGRVRVRAEKGDYVASMMVDPEYDKELIAYYIEDLQAKLLWVEENHVHPQ